MPKRSANAAGLDDSSEQGDTWKPLSLEEMAKRGRKLLTIKKSALAMRKPETASDSVDVSWIKTSADAASPASDKSPVAQPEAKVPKTEASEEKKEGTEKKEEAEKKDPPPFTFTPSTPIGESTTTPPAFSFAASTPTDADGKESTPFNFSSTTSFSFTSPAFQSPFTFAPAKKKDGEDGEAPKSMFATWTPPSGSTATFKPLDAGAPAPGSVFGTSSSDHKPASKAEEAPRVSGEEEEECVFSIKGRVYVSTKREDGTSFWREHGKGPIKINVHKETKRSRIVMRTDGTFQLKMNMRIFPDMGLKQLNDRTTFISGFEGSLEPVSFLIKTRIKQEATALFEALETQKKASSELAPSQGSGASEEKAEEVKPTDVEKKVEEGAAAEAETKSEELKETASRSEAEDGAAEGKTAKKEDEVVEKDDQAAANEAKKASE